MKTLVILCKIMPKKVRTHHPEKHLRRFGHLTSDLETPPSPFGQCPKFWTFFFWTPSLIFIKFQVLERKKAIYYWQSFVLLSFLKIFLVSCILAYLHTCILLYPHTWTRAYLYTYIPVHLHTCTLHIAHLYGFGCWNFIW